MFSRGPRLLNNVLTSRYIPTCSMYLNPHLEEFKKKRAAVSLDFYKQSTGLTGLFVNEHPHHSLRIIYGRIIRALQKIPVNSHYRINTEQIIKHRLLLLEQEPDVRKLEEKIGMGQLEEVIEQAANELKTVRDIIDARAWEPLVEEPKEEQWRWPIH